MILFGLCGPLTDLHLVALSVVVKLNLMLLLHTLYFKQVLLRECSDFNGVPLVNLGSHFVPDVIIQVLNLLEDSSLQLGASAGSLSQLIITIVIDAPLTARPSPEFLDDRQFFLEHLLQVVEFSLQVSKLAVTVPFKKFFLHASDGDLLGQEQVLVGQHVCFKVLDLLLEQLLELCLDKLSLTIKNLNLGLVTSLNDGLVEEDLLFTDLNRRILELDPVEHWVSRLRFFSDSVDVLLIGLDDLN